jgi:hypothetical protein
MLRERIVKKGTYVQIIVGTGVRSHHDFKVYLQRNFSLVPRYGTVAVLIFVQKIELDRKFSFPQTPLKICSRVWYPVPTKVGQQFYIFNDLVTGK